MKQYNIFRKFRLLNFILYVVFLSMRRVAPFEFLVANRKVPALLILFSLILILWNFFAFQSLFKGKHISYLLIFLGISGLSILINYRYGVSSSISLWVYHVIQFVLLYSTMFMFNVEDNINDMKVINFIFILFQLVYSVIALITYFYDVEFTYTTSTLGKIVEQGFQPKYGRVWGIYYEANYLGIASLASILLSLLNLHWTSKVLLKIFYALSVFFNLFTVVLSGSRATKLAVFFSVVLGIISIFIYLRKRLKIGFIIFLCILSVSASILALLGYYNLVQSKLPSLKVFLKESYITQEDSRNVNLWFKNIYSYNGFTTNFAIDQNTKENIKDEKPSTDDSADKLERFDMQGDVDKSNRRFEAVKDGLKIFQQKPLLGVSMRNAVTYAKEHHITDNDHLLRGKTLYNAYLEVLVGTGILGFLSLFLFFLKIFIDYINYLKHKRTHIKFIIVCLMLLSSYFVFALTQTDIIADFTINSLLFWCYIGIGSDILSSSIEHDKEVKKNLFICDTPLQILNAVNFQVNFNEKSDIAIVHQFNDSQQISNRLKKEEIFENVIDIQPFDKKKNMFSKFKSLFRILFAEKTLKKHSNLSIEKKRYRKLIVSFYTHITDLIRFLNSNAEVIQIEDGLGTYTTVDLERHYRSKSYLLFNKYFLSNKLSYNPSRLYVYAPELVPDNNKLVTCNLITLSKDNHALPILKRVFSYEKNSDFSKASTIYFTQPLEEKIESALASNVEEDVLEVLPQDAIVRVHPRQNKDFYSKKFAIDTSKNMWELSIPDVVNDDTLLISAFSTSQIMPFILYNLKPNLVFLYPLYGGEWGDVEQLIDKMKRVYSDDNKIMVVQTLEELRAILA